MTDLKTEKIKTDEAPLLASSSPVVTSLYQDFIYLSLKSAETQKTYYFATMNFLNFCHRNEVEDVRDIEPTKYLPKLDAETLINSILY